MSSNMQIIVNGNEDDKWSIRIEFPDYDPSDQNTYIDPNIKFNTEIEARQFLDNFFRILENYTPLYAICMVYTGYEYNKSNINSYYKLPRCFNDYDEAERFAKSLVVDSNSMYSSFIIQPIIDWDV